MLTHRRADLSSGNGAEHSVEAISGRILLIIADRYLDQGKSWNRLALR